MLPPFFARKHRGAYAGAGAGNTIGGKYYSSVAKCYRTVVARAAPYLV